jgi:hypothetical protein
MESATNPRHSSFTLPTFAAVRARRERLALGVTQLPPQVTTPPEEPPVAEEPRHAQDPEATEPLLTPATEPSALGPSPLADAALYGLPGRAVRSLEPHSEADPAALLLQFLAAAGNLAGPAPHSLVGSTRHGLNLFVILVGESSKARKGTSWRQVASLFNEVDSLWASRRVTTNRPTVNSILQALRNEQPATDRRLFLLSEEFASVLHPLGRESGQLSPLLRCAWDGGDLGAHDGRRLIQATAAHISLVGHITQSELLRHLGRTESHNGFANRCLWTSVHRSKSLPQGSTLPPQEASALARELRRAFDWVQSQSHLVFHRNPQAQQLWNDCYPALSQGRPDVYGAATSRAEAQVLRLGAIYAALDCSPAVEVCHLQAALAIWDYCRASARLFFDTAPIDPTARRISQALDVTPQGLTRSQIRCLFHRHVSKERIDLALDQLTSLGLIGCEALPGRGRPSTLWSKVGDTTDANP